MGHAEELGVDHGSVGSRGGQVSLHPLLFTPIYRRYLWGGRGFATLFGRDLPAGDDYAESWEVVDRAADRSVVAAGPLAGRTLSDLVATGGREILGRHAGLHAYPLLFKFLDARRDLSVQVHPDDGRAARLSPPDKGKTEAWYVVDAAPGARLWAGLRQGTDRRRLAEALAKGRCDEVLHVVEPKRGDCIFIPAGTIHAIGAGLVVAEIQQSSDVTYRLHDWNRTGPDGKPRALHVEAGLEAVTAFDPVEPVPRRDTGDPAVKRLVACPYFCFDEVRFEGSWTAGGDDRCHLLAVIAGRVRMDDRFRLPALGPGSTVLLPAAIGSQTLRGEGPVTLLRVMLP